MNNTNIIYENNENLKLDILKDYYDSNNITFSNDFIILKNVLLKENYENELLWLINKMFSP
jgi:hypothetical protein